MSLTRKVEVVPYNPSWAALFEKESELIMSLFKPEHLTLHHIGSTSVPNLSAKPIIDILGEVDRLELFDELTPKLDEMNYMAKGENGMKGRRYFYKVTERGSANRTVHLHVFQKGNPEIKRHLLFRDYLRSHPAAVQKYAAIKEKAARLYPEDIDSYMAMKDPVIKNLEAEAIEWGNNE